MEITLPRVKFTPTCPTLTRGVAQQLCPVTDMWLNSARGLHRTSFMYSEAM